MGREDRPSPIREAGSGGVPPRKNGIPRSSGAGMGFSAELEALIEEQSAKHDVSPDLVRAVVKTESNGRHDAVSNAGAVGLMQLMPETAQGLGVDPKNPTKNLDGGIRYLKAMAQKFGSLDEALAAYNAGPGAVSKYGGIPPYPETQQYVKKIRNLLRGQGS